MTTTTLTSPVADPANLTIRPATTPSDWIETTALLHDYVEWLRAAVGVEPLDEQPALGPELADLAGHYGIDERSVLFVAHLGRQAVGTVAIRADGRGGAELKRMYLRPVARGGGLADRLVLTAVEAAAERGCHTIWLETMRGVMEPALTVYRRNGFTELDGGGRSSPLDGMVTLQRPTHPIER